MSGNDPLRPVGPGNRVRPAPGGSKGSLQKERARPGRPEEKEEPEESPARKPKGGPGHIDEHV